MRIYITVLFLLVVSVLRAQTDKGSIMAGGHLSLNTNKGGSSFRFNPQLGFFIADNLVIGGDINMDFSKAGTVKTSEFGIGPFGRYYFGKKQTKPFLVSSANYITVSSKSNSVDINSTGWSFLFGAGFAAFLNRNIAVEGITGYRYANYSNTEGAGGFNLSLGFQLYFARDVVKDIKKTVTGQ
jgi:hypothetical protein